MARSLYDAWMLPIEDGALRGIRQSATYRNAVWLTRVANLVGLPVVVWGIVSILQIGPTLPQPVFIGAWAVGCVTLVPAVVLFYRSGTPFGCKGFTWLTDKRVGNAILGDVFWLRP
ncbi:hypothetical protein KIF24_10240 [Micromonospora sp. Llam7]|uniref:hypothetical protein n=1 Tax=Micromonospora tarapacensis TaxID=2835305 RepID=UPI001C83D134|nr:hypothetical protein [Micromonospora tarapacensis]MBX7266364.1 hypothetical protein [Micromonospora tarapacensis]